MLLTVVGLGASPAAAHDLEFSRLVLRVESNRVRGELSLDPKATAGDPGAPAEGAEAKVMTRSRRIPLVEAYARANVQLAFDRGTPKLDVSIIDVAEVSDRAGLDLVELVWTRPAAAASFTVRSSGELGDLAVSVEEHGAGGLRSHSVLVRGGERSPVYSLGRDAGQAWQTGGIDVLAASASGGSGATLPVSSARAAPSPRVGSSEASRSSADAPPSAAGEVTSRGAERSGFDEPWTRTFWRYLQWGFEHILPQGVDHIVFIAGLVLLSARRRDLLLWVTSFTVAHTMTLGLSALGAVGLSSAVVEPLIAFSIAYVGFEGVGSRQGRSATLRRTGVVFGFGLLHGLGFAGVLGEIGLAPGAALLSLLAFNVGVELGQVVVVVIAAMALRALPERWRDRARRSIAFAIGGLGLVWGVSRTLGGW